MTSWSPGIFWACWASSCHMATLSTFVAYRGRKRARLIQMRLWAFLYKKKSEHIKVLVNYMFNVLHSWTLAEDIYTTKILKGYLPNLNAQLPHNYNKRLSLRLCLYSYHSRCVQLHCKHSTVCSVIK